MVGNILLEVQRFSRQNWWIYILLFIALGVVFFTGKGNLLEIIILFFLNLLWNLCTMMMQSLYKDNKLALWSTFLLVANSIFTIVALYGFFGNNEGQYILWQIVFFLSWLKVFLLYNYDYDIKWVSPKYYVVYNSILLYITYFVLGIQGYWFIQAIGFAFITLWFTMTQDSERYFTILVGIIFLSIGNISWIVDNYITGYILGITVSYGLLSLTTFSFYVKLLPTYITRLRN